MINFEKGRVGFARVSSRDGKNFMVHLGKPTSMVHLQFETAGE
jgi:hypothetical protein